MPTHSKNEPRLDAPQYVAKRDGSMRDYLERCRDEQREGLFLGPSHYRELWDAKLLEPDIASIRIMYNFARPDEHYTVKDRESVEGLDGNAHAGLPGRHQIDAVIPAHQFMFEVHYWKR
jgi:hypothetical protein